MSLGFVSSVLTQFCYGVVLLAEYIHDILDQWMTLGRPNRLAFCNFAPHLRHVFKLSLPSPCRQHPLTRIIAFCVERVGTPIQGLHPILLQAKISLIFFPTRNQLMDDSKDCAPWSPCFRYSDPNLRTFLFRKTKKFRSVFDFDLCVCAHGITFLSTTAG